MKRVLLAGVAGLMVLASCGAIRDSRLNPMNWFGRSQAVATAPVPAGPYVAPDTRPLVAQVIEMSVEPAPEGAIVRATGLPPSQGWWDGELVLREDTPEGSVVYDFRLTPPLEPRRAGTPFSRQVTVGAFLTNRQLETIREITVQGAGNARSSRR